MSLPRHKQSGPRQQAGPRSPTCFEVRLPGPLDASSSLELFRRSGDDLLDRWDGSNLVRTIRIGDRRFAYACAAVGTVEAPAFRVTVEHPSHRSLVARALGSTFVPAPTEFPQLLARDPVLARLAVRWPGLRPVLQFDLLTALVRCISAQQVNLRWAATTRARLAQAFGDEHVVGGHAVHSLSAERLAAASVAEIRALQFTTRKAEYIINAAEAIASGRLSEAGLADLPDEEVISRLTELRGLGLWTAEWILARTLGRPRVVAGDLGVRKAVGLAYLGKSLPSDTEVRSATRHWGKSAGVAQVLLLHALANGKLP